MRADGASGVGRNVTSLAHLGGENLVVTTPEPPAISAAFGLLKLLDAGGPGPAPGVVVNQATGSLEARETFGHILKACKQFLTITPTYLGWLPHDPAVMRAVRAREPFVLTDPAGPAAQAVVRLAQRVLQNDPVRDPEGQGCSARDSSAPPRAPGGPAWPAEAAGASGGWRRSPRTDARSETTSIPVGRDQGP